MHENGKVFIKNVNDKKPKQGVIYLKIVDN